MIEMPEQKSGCAYLGILSVAASALGSAVAAVVFAGMEYFLPSGSFGTASAAEMLMAVLIFFFFGGFIAVPIGLVLGLPLLALSRRYLCGPVISATLTFALLGLLAAFGINYIDESSGHSGAGSAALVFGAVVGGMHPLVYGRANGVRWSRIAAALLFSAAIVPSVAYAWEDVDNLLASRTEFEARCADPYGSMAFVGERAVLDPYSNRSQFLGKWNNQRKWRSLYDREDWLPLDDGQVLVARDFAYVPSGFAGWITGGRRVERHCLSEKQGSDADMLRGRGVGNWPRLEDLAD